MAVLPTDTLTAPPTRLAYPPVEVAGLLGLSRSKVMALVADGTIPSLKIDRSRRIRHEDVVAYLDRLSTTGGPAQDDDHG